MNYMGPSLRSRMTGVQFYRKFAGQHTRVLCHKSALVATSTEIHVCRVGRVRCKRATSTGTHPSTSESSTLTYNELMEQHSRASIRKSFQEWWRRSRAEAGLGATSRKLSALIWEFVRDSTAARKRQRYGDIDYDWEHRVDTTGATVGWRTRVLGLLHTDYQPIEPELFREMIGCLQIDFSQFTFIDIG